MTVAFNRDLWIKDMIRRRYLIVHEDGSIFRCIKADDAGNLLSTEYRQIKVQVHKKSGRVYFNAKWRGITKSYLVNRVVAIRFLPNPLNLPQVNHVDGDKEHNYLRQPTQELRDKWGEFQLEWSSGADNERHAHRTGLKSGRGSANSNAKLTADQVLAIRASRKTPTELACEYMVGRSTILNVLNGKSWSHL
ncbi:hypothetical protein [Paracoccus litorisediminis]|uniref:HNH endonuclease n=1 Tax=Paracoccus litorisediminis TaxID=2006130 RepID=A0A844HPS1_9RHOB|nr:hypothetical protein [Paracoccus litorisediminis]MTH61129.1 hypothetical protein [Paracoccus litorisediminis]